MTPACPPDLSGAVFALVGAAVSLGGLLLVFSGFLYSRAAAFPSTTDDRIIQRFKTVAQLGLIPFALSLVIAGIGSLYYVFGSQITSIVVGAFELLVVLTIVYGIVASRFL